MSSSSDIEQLKEKLLSCLDEERNVTNMAGALDVITTLESSTISREVLESTRLGLLVNDVRRKNQDANQDLGKRCRALIKEWQRLIAAGSAGAGGVAGKLGISPGGFETLTTPSSAPGSRTATPRQTATARLLAESGLRCSPSPATTSSRAQQHRPMENGALARASSSTKIVSPEQPQTASSNSYAPSQTTNGPGPSGQSALKIRIKYGSADQQATIIREIEPYSSNSSPNQIRAGNGTSGAEEVSNRRKRKTAPVNVPLGLVNGSKSVSPSTPVPSPKLRAVASTSATDSLAAIDSTAGAKKSKSSSPDRTSATATVSQRPKLKSTAELVAEMTSSYPETMSISLKDVVSTPSSPPLNASSSKSVMASILAAEAGRADDLNDEDYVDPSTTKKGKSSWTLSFVVKEEHKNREKRGKKTREKTDEKLNNKKTETVKRVEISKPVDWYAAVQLPPLDLSVLDVVDDDGNDSASTDVIQRANDRTTAEAPATCKMLDSCKIVFDDDRGEEPSTSTKNEETLRKIDDTVRWRSRLLHTTLRGDRQVLAMPYVDIGLPDFLEYSYKNRGQYLAHWSER